MEKSTKQYPILLFRADASEEIGIGHIMRCLALAQTFQVMGCEIIFLCWQIPEKLEKLLHQENIGVVIFAGDHAGSTEDARITARAARALQVDWIIADGYGFDGPYQKIIKEHHLNLMVLDDYGHADHYAADIILNPGIHPDPDVYLHREPSAQLLLGPQYFPLRREFLETCRCPKLISAEGSKVLVTLGGADPNQTTLKVIESLKEMDNLLQICVVVGPSYANPGQLSVIIDRRPILLLQNQDSMAALMSWADIGISAGGVTLAEMAYLGLPTIVIQTAENQAACKYYDTKYGTSVYLGDAETVTKDQILDSVMLLYGDSWRRQKMRENGWNLIDGNGGRRVYEALMQHSIIKC